VIPSDCCAWQKQEQPDTERYRKPRRTHVAGFFDETAGFSFYTLVQEFDEVALTRKQDEWQSRRLVSTGIAWIEGLTPIFDEFDGARPVVSAQSRMFGKTEPTLMSTRRPTSVYFNGGALIRNLVEWAAA
jgi:hypothetical protein